MSDKYTDGRAQMFDDQPGPALSGAETWLFFLLLLLLSLPFYALGAAGGRLPIATFFPMSALMAFVPSAAALILVCRARGVSGAKAFLGRALDYRRIEGVEWLLTPLLLMPVLYLVAYGALRLVGRALPDVQFYPIAEMVAFALVFFVGAIGEELGWQGFAYSLLKKGNSALMPALTLGAIWAFWHVIPHAQMGRGASWIVWQCLGAVALRVIIVWLFVNTGQSVFVAVLLHMTINMPWGFVQNYESFYDPFIVFVILAVVAGTVVAIWGSSTLARFRYARGRA